MNERLEHPEVAMMGAMPPEPPAGRSAEAARRWREQHEAFRCVGRLTPARAALLTSWARALDSAADAQARWSEAGSPQTGPRGWQRRGVALAVERADAEVARLSAQIEKRIERWGATAGGGRAAGGRIVRDGLLVRGGLALHAPCTQERVGAR